MKSQGLIEGGGHVNHRYVEEEAGFASLIRERERERERWEVEFLSGLAHRQSGTSSTGIGGSP